MNRIILFLLCVSFASCFNKKKEVVVVNSLEDAHRVYGDMTTDDLTKWELDGQWVKPRVMTFDLKKSISNPPPTSNVDSVLIIPLETTDDCLIAEISKIVFKNNLFYIWDRGNANLFIFDARGSFKTKVGAEGRGPEEYEELSDFAVGDNGDVFLVDNFSKKIFVFNSEGAFKRSITLENDYARIQARKDVLVLTLRNSQDRDGKVYRVEILDTLGKTHKYYFPFDAQLENRPLGFKNLGTRVHLDNNFIYFPQLGLQAYVIDGNGKLKESYLFDLSDLATPPWLTVGAKIAQLGAAEINKIRDYSTLLDVFDLDDYVFAQISSIHVVYVLFNKKTGHYDLLLHANPNARKWPSAAFYGTEIVGATEGNVLIGYSTMSDFKMRQGFESPYTFDFGKYNQQISDRDEDANPMIALIKVKTTDGK